MMLAVLSAGFIGSAQDKETRQERIQRWKDDMAAFKAGQARDTRVYDAADSIAGLQAGKALKNASFVLEADAVTFRHGTRVLVNSTTNFISVKGKRAVVQVSPSYTCSGPNGVGGITVDGTISDVSVSRDKRGNTRYSMNVTGIMISARVDIVIVADSSRAYATVMPNFSSNSVRLDGHVVPYSLSGAVEGMSM